MTAATPKTCSHVLRQRLGLAETKRRFPQRSTCLAIYSRVVNAQQSLADVLAANWPWCVPWHDELKRLFGAYVAEKQAQRVLDFDDLLAWWAEALREPAIAAEMAARFDHVLVDEYQDTNRLQAEILLRALPRGRGLTVVGDDAQSIYSFRAAEVRNILDFAACFAPPAAIVTLERNYRSTMPLLEASNAVIALAAERHARTCGPMLPPRSGRRWSGSRDESEQASWVAERVLQLRESGLALKSQAVLFRAAQHSNALELELARRDIPFVKYGGLKFLDAAHVKDVLCGAALRRQPARRARRPARAAARLRHRRGACRPPDGADRRQRRSARRRWRRLRRAAPAAAAWAEFAACSRACASRNSAWPDELAAVESLVSAAARASARGRCAACRRHRPSGSSRRPISVTRALPHRARARSARGDQRRVRTVRATTRTT